MQGIQHQITKDLKQALLSGDKELASILRGIRSVILNEEISLHKRDTGLDDTEIVSLLQKEIKKLKDSIAVYERAKELDRAAKDQKEVAVIQKYLPKELDESAVEELIDKAVTEIGPPSPQTMGSIIGWVKNQSAGAVDGATVAAKVKARMNP